MASPTRTHRRPSRRRRGTTYDRGSAQHEPGLESRTRRRTRRSSHGTRSGLVGLLLCIVVLNLIGLVMVLSASSVTALYDYDNPWHFFIRQGIWVVAGLALMIVALNIDYHHWQRLALPMVVLSVVLLVAVLFVGIEVNGAQRWLGTESLSIQPSEFAKLAVIIFIADLLARRVTHMDKTAVTLRPVIVVLGLLAGLVMLQPNLGTTLLLGAIAISILFVAGTPLLPLGKILALAVAGAAALALVAPYRFARIKAVLDPWEDPLNTGYQPIQSMNAVANGGLTGRGLGESRAKWDFLPEAHTDFIFSIISEELGLIGGVLILALFVTFGVFGVRTALRAPDRFGMLIAAGVTAWIMFQTFVNIGAALGRLPITGVPLPFVSFGGSSMLVTMIAAGLLCNVARQAE
jgi:cell division protein FtsW